MKSMKKTLALLLALVMALALAVPAFAADALTGSIEIKKSETVAVSGKTFNAYKVLDAAIVGGSDKVTNVSYTVPDSMKDFYAKRYSLTTGDALFDQKVAEKIAEETNMFDFATAVLAAAKAAHVEPGTATAGGGAASVTINNLPFGYYVVEDVGTAAPISALMLDTVGTVGITIKADRPDIDKKINGAKDTDPSANGLTETNNVAMGDKVPYVITSRVPKMTGYQKYFFVVNDTMSKGLTFNKDVAINVGGTLRDGNITGGTTLRSGTDFTVSQATLPDGSTTVKIVFNDFYSKFKNSADEPIYITYSATLNTQADVTVAGNPNTVNLVYSHNPNIVPKGVNEPNEEDKEKGVVGQTPDKIVKTFVTALEVTKQDEAGRTLTGAEFKLEGERLNTVLITGDNYVKSEEGTYYKLKDGSYTEIVPNEHTNAQYESTSQKYAKKTETTTVVKKEAVEYRGFVNNTGKLKFTGLAAGTYTLTELVAPNGYNMLREPITINIKCNLPETAAGNCSWTVNEPAVAAGNLITLEVVNTTGTELPDTGGIGTTIFYVAGGILMVGAAVLLITKKRMSGSSK